MGDIIALHDDPHQATQALLPWYVNGALEADEHALVEAHLAACAECQGALAWERRLKSEIAALPVEAEQAWARLRDRLPRRDARPHRRWFGRGEGARAPSPWLGLALAAQAGVFILAGLALAPLVQPRYHALSAAAPARPAGNLVVIFRPDTPERDLRAALVDNHLRLVDGPTASDAYILAAPPAQRAAILARLRARPDIVLAEPVEPGAPG